MTELTVLPGLRAWADRYDAILCDVWGVLHDGVNVHPDAADALQRFRAGGGRVLLLSNAPRPGHLVIEQLEGMGVPRDAYDDALSSGDVARAWLMDRPNLPIGLITAAMHEPTLEGIPLQIVGPEAAEYLLVTAMEDDETESPEDYREILSRYREADVPLVCANPDYVVERGGRLIYCAGALADMYRDMGGEVIDTGKPSSLIYDTALQRLRDLRGEQIALDRLLAIGDAVRTDAKGAADLGCDLLFMAQGIHADDVLRDGEIDQGAAATLFSKAGVQPRAIQTKLRW